MNRVRRIELRLALVLIALLAALSIVGAFPGVSRSRALFNSVPLIVFWFLLAVLLITAFFSFRRLLRSPGLLAMHLGVLLILGGAIWGSARGHGAARQLLNQTKFPSGYMRIFQGETVSTVYADLKFEPDGVIGRLPFSLHLAQFAVEHYPPEQERWDLVLVAPLPKKDRCPPGSDNADEPMQTEVDWTVGEDLALPHTEGRAKVLQYLESARPVYPEDHKSDLEIVGPSGRRTFLPAVEGQAVDLDDPKVTVRVVRVFANLVVKDAGDQHEVIDAGGGPENPAVQVEMVFPDGARERRYIMTRFPAHGQQVGGPQIHYRFPEPIRAEPDPHTGQPAMEILLTHNGTERREWLIPGARDRYVWVSLAPEAEVAAQSDDGEAGELRSPRLYLVRPEGPIKDYKSDLLVLDEGQKVARKVVEVNDPLHYGGYHFYQHSYDSRAGRYTVLSVSSDSGLWAVYIGFILLVAGAFWNCWGRSGWAYVIGRNNRGD